MWPCENLTDLELDGLKESMNICMGKAASALSEIFGKQVRISIPQVILEPAEQIRGALGAYDRVVAVSISIVGDAKGDLMLFFNKPDASSLANLLLGDSGDGGGLQVLDEQKKSALTEVGNIVLSGFLNSLAEFTSATFMHEVPRFHETSQEIFELSRSTQFMKRDGSLGFLLRAEFEVDSDVAGGSLFLFPELSLLSMLIKSIRNMLGC